MKVARNQNSIPLDGHFALLDINPRTGFSALDERCQEGRVDIGSLQKLQAFDRAAKESIDTAFRYFKDDDEKTPHVGVIAQDLQKGEQIDWKSYKKVGESRLQQSLDELNYGRVETAGPRS